MTLMYELNLYILKIYLHSVAYNSQGRCGVIMILADSWLHT